MTEQNPKKATEVLVDIDTKIDNLLQAINSLDLKVAIISNKLNDLSKPQNNKITVEAVQAPSVRTTNPNDVPVFAEQKILEETSPVGFRRTSRPETYAGDDAYLNAPAKKQKEPDSFPIQIPRANGQSEVVIPKAVTEEIKPPSDKSTNFVKSGSNIPVMQRVVDKNGKGIFLADVEIINAETMDKVSSTRTNGAGKWQAVLSTGTYKVIVKKRESLTKEKMESVQTITVDGSKSPLELQVAIIRS